LPLPDAPTTTEKRCDGISRLMPRNAGTSSVPDRYVLATWRNRTTGAAGFAAAAAVIHTAARAT